MFLRIILFIFIFSAFHSVGQQPVFKLFLVGDAGEDEITGETLDTLRSKLLHNPESAIVFMGDNCYKNTFLGLVEGFKGFDSSKTTIRKLHSQMDILNDYNGSAYFVPGNHDWWNITDFKLGKRKLKMEESFIEETLHNNPALSNKHETFLPKDGEPGPASVELNTKKERIIFIDTYWLILLGFKNNPERNTTTANSFYHNLDSILSLATSEKQSVVVVAHHPVYYTKNAVNKSSLVFPNQLKHPYFLGRIKQSSIFFPSYDTMANRLKSIFQKYPGIFYCSGHIHALQYHAYNGVNYIISGAGSKTIKVKNKSGVNDFNDSANCELWNEKVFFEMDFYKDSCPGILIYHQNGRQIIEIKCPSGS